MSFVTKKEVVGEDYLSRHRCSVPSAKNLGVGTVWKCEDAACNEEWELQSGLGDYGNQIDWRIKNKPFWKFSNKQYIVSSALSEEDAKGMVHHPVDGYIA